MSNSTSNNKMSVMQLTLLTALNMMGSGIIMLPTKLAEIGTFSILSWLVTATGSTAMAYAFAKCGMLSRRPGGMGGYSEYAFGQSGNFMANYTYAVSLIIANVAIAVTVVGYASALFDVTLSPVGTCIATIAAIGAEAGWKWAVGAVVYNTALAWGMAWLTYHIVQLF